MKNQKLSLLVLSFTMLAFGSAFAAEGKVAPKSSNSPAAVVVKKGKRKAKKAPKTEAPKEAPAGEAHK